MLLLIAWILVINLRWSSKFLAVRVGSIMLRPTQTYDEKMKRTFGPFYDFMVFARENTPVDAVIAMPPLNVSRYAGHISYPSYFVYPRKIARANEGTLVLDEAVTHVAIYSGWPKEPLPEGTVINMPQRLRLFIDDLEVHYGTGQRWLWQDFESMVSPVLSAQNLHDGRTLNAHQVAQITLTERGERLGCRWLGLAPPQLNAYSGDQSEHLDITYSRDGPDYWGLTVEIPVHPSTTVQAKVRSTMKESVSIFASVLFADGHSSMFHSPPNPGSNQWETLELKGLYETSKKYGALRKWDVGALKIERLGIRIGDIPFEKWGLLELRKDER